MVPAGVRTLRVPRRLYNSCMNGLLATYLRDHSAAAAGGLDLFRRMARAQQARQWGPQLASLRDEVAEDRLGLEAILTELKVPPAPLLTQFVRLGERVARLKPNGSLVFRSPLSDVVELEAAVSAVRAKGCGWRALVAADVVVRSTDVPALIVRAESQLERLLAIHRSAAAAVLGDA